MFQKIHRAQPACLVSRSARISMEAPFDFFFQAEDGIRYRNVTGVQTCALPIFCMGMAASMGSFLLMAGEAGQRIALPNARIMLHQPSGGFQGQASDIERHAEDIIRTKRRLNELYAKHCGRTYEEVERTLDRDFFMSAEEAKEWGIVDHIYDSRAAAEADS